MSNLGPIEKRAEMINLVLSLPQKSLDAAKDIRVAIDQCAETINKITSGVDHDPAQLSATMALLQQAKNVACDSVILPHATK